MPRIKSNALESANKSTNGESEQLYCFGGRTGNRFLTSVSRFDPKTEQWNDSVPILVAKGYFGGTVIGSRIYICGGQFDGKRLKIMEVFDCRTNGWSPLGDLPEERCYPAMAALNEQFIYVAGGFASRYGYQQTTDSVLQYRVDNDSWLTVKPMKDKRNLHNLVHLNGRLYAIGSISSSTCEVYEPNRDEWNYISSTQNRHINGGAVAHNGRLYVCNDKSFEVYFPDLDVWKPLPTLDIATGRSLASFGGKLWALGGGTQQGPTKSVFEFDESAGQWRQLADMDTPRMCHSSFVVNY